MADVRALLKSKRQEARISHPYATYTTSGQLKCSICASIVKHASAWEGHLGSKAHRTNILRLREEERRRQDVLLAKEREAEQLEEQEGEEEEELVPQEVKGKRKSPSSVEADGSHVDKKRKVDGAQPALPKAASSSSSFPADFFSDPNHAPVLLSEVDEDEDEDKPPAEPTKSKSQEPTSVVDLEYERFQRELLASAATADPSETFARATVYAEPVIVSTETAGLPAGAGGAVEVQQAPEPTEEEIRLKKEQEERELIMDRLLEEERAQEDADTRVQMLKNKLEGLRKRREAKRTKAKPS
ncbi:hypothetical protein NLJ89_g1060 [Agrocybe chaxingu]|uniref:Coiled-coil domain-containing protein 16 n=1 Tax=Agrocybe chaxingu TaxID=84603 RepID=A0A9W8N0T6_9AGAR|nr:hypothetical protein NLJ89_g1060 [Agrocybe chaxingu]